MYTFCSSKFVIPKYTFRIYYILQKNIMKWFSAIISISSNYMCKDWNVRPIDYSYVRNSRKNLKVLS